MLSSVVFIVVVREICRFRSLDESFSSIGSGGLTCNSTSGFAWRRIVCDCKEHLRQKRYVSQTAQTTGYCQTTALCSDGYANGRSVVATRAK